MRFKFRKQKGPKVKFRFRASEVKDSQPVVPDFTEADIVEFSAPETSKPVVNVPEYGPTKRAAQWTNEEIRKYARQIVETNKVLGTLKGYV